MMTTAGEIRAKLTAGEWSALEALEGLTLALGDTPVDGVSPALDDDETWLLIAELLKRAGLSAAKMAIMLKALL